MQTDTLIVGAGLSGLALAERLERVQGDYLLLEARDRTGGRILSRTVRGQAFDLGPAWFWPGQPRLESLLSRLGLTFFEQFSDGDTVSEDQSGNARRGSGFASMQGSYRIDGGISQLTETIATNLSEARVFLGSRLTKLVRSGGGVQAEIVSTNRSWIVNAQRVVLALPPRVAERGIDFSPGLAEDARQAMRAIPTWMAGQAKTVAVYDRPVWRDRGLSGDAMSRCGPMIEIHDASPQHGGPYALFGFVGVPAEARLLHHEPMMEMAVAQLERLFGPGMTKPISMVLQDWAQDALTATAADNQPATHHPSYGLPQALRNVWDKRLLFGSTETAPRFGGYLEGALEASEIVFDQLPLSA